MGLILRGRQQTYSQIRACVYVLLGRHHRQWNEKAGGINIEP